MKIGGIKKIGRAVVGQGHSLVDRARRGGPGLCSGGRRRWRHSGRPAINRAVFRGKEENGRPAGSAVGYREVRGAVEELPSRRAIWNADLERVFYERAAVDIAAVKSRRIGAVVRNPEIAAGLRKGDAPGIDQLGIRKESHVGP